MPTRLVLVRHGETEWSATGRHTGLTDIGLSAVGEAEAKLVPASLGSWEFSTVVSSPLQRAVATAHIAGYEPAIDDAMVEWDYGEVEGRTNDEITSDKPGWSKWHDEVPGGEQVADVGARADDVLARIGDEAGDVLLFAHGHFFSILVARWIDLPAAEGRRFPLKTSSVTVLGQKRTDRVIHQLNHRCGDQLHH
jgi:probable phosphoglycerate mutase